MLRTRLIGVLGAFAVVITATPAEALVTPPTTTRPFKSAVVDEPASWERESSCDPTEKEGPRKLRRLLDATYGHMYSNIVRSCTASDSGHEEGRALDWMVNVRVPEQKEIAESFLSWLAAPDESGNTAAMARRLGISYVIWNNGMWRPSTATWTTYSKCDRPKWRFKRYDNTCHRNHVHVSFSWAGALGRTSYFTGYVACPEALTAPWVPAVLPQVSDVVPVEPVRVLGTRRGVGLPTGPCRAAPDVRLDVPVLGVGGVPPSGVSSVVLRVAVSKPDASAELRVWTAGTAVPLEPAVLVAAKTEGSATVTVPVGIDGLVSLQLAGGMGHLVVDAIGYTSGGVLPPA
ncbi:MAG: hypothetical protein ACRDWY_15685 [Actinomycetes bacterium]